MAKTKKMKNILVLCTGNSCRSQMAEAYLRFFLKEKTTIYSAGIETHGLNPRAVEIMKEDGIDISHYTCNCVDEYRNISFDSIITVCDHANENCPYFPGNAKRFHQNFPDPAKATGTEDEIMNQFRSLRNGIKKYVETLVKENF